MKNLTFVAFLILFCAGCKKEELDQTNPDVATFVRQIKNGTYDNYEKDDSGKKLWPIMPKFTKDHIQALIILAQDTSHVEIFPINPMSSRTPKPEGRNYFILGECLLWTVEGIRNGRGYGSLDPYLIDVSKGSPYKGVIGKDVLIVRDLYQDWYNNFKEKNWEDINPLEGKPYRWF